VSRQRTRRANCKARVERSTRAKPCVRLLCGPDHPLAVSRLAIAASQVVDRQASGAIGADLAWGCPRLL